MQRLHLTFRDWSFLPRLRLPLLSELYLTTLHVEASATVPSSSMISLLPLLCSTTRLKSLIVEGPVTCLLSSQCTPGESQNSESGITDVKTEMAPAHGPHSYEGHLKRRKIEVDSHRDAQASTQDGPVLAVTTRPAPPPLRLPYLSTLKLSKTSFSPACLRLLSAACVDVREVELLNALCSHTCGHSTVQHGVLPVTAPSHSCASSTLTAWSAFPHLQLTLLRLEAGAETNPTSLTPALASTVSAATHPLLRTCELRFTATVEEDVSRCQSIQAALSEGLTLAGPQAKR